MIIQTLHYLLPVIWHHVKASSVFRTKKGATITVFSIYSWLGFQLAFFHSPSPPPTDQKHIRHCSEDSTWREKILGIGALDITYLSVGASRLSYSLREPSPHPAISKDLPIESQARLVTQLSAPVGISWKRCINPSRKTVIILRVSLISNIYRKSTIVFGV